mmetsp:Transcript_11134/g.21744  ORF Transcript_11134/g.21744 Transcript_11134/m.21744 type:complete len:257 (+) Transcript_11134:142-912(+)
MNPKGLFQSLLRGSVVLGRDEGHLGHLGTHKLLANLAADPSTVLSIGAVNVTHSHGLVQNWAKGTTRDLTNELLLLLIVDLSVSAGGSTINNKTDTDAGRFVVTEFTLHHIGTREASLGAARLAHGPGQTGTNRGSTLVDIISIKAKTSLKAKGITCTKACRGYLFLVHEELHKSRSISICNGDLKAIFTSVSAASHSAVKRTHLANTSLHEVHLLDIKALGKTLHNNAGLGALEGKKGKILKVLNGGLHLALLEL